MLTQEQKLNYELLKPLYISAKEQIGVEELKDELLVQVNLANLNTDDVLVTNIRHVEALQHTRSSLERVLYGIDNPVTSDFLAMDIRQSLYHLGEITGSVSTDDLLDNIFKILYREVILEFNKKTYYYSSYLFFDESLSK
ncbi:hypothetical protein OKW96_11090 [Sphingobacterium sp. KU25419]|nr:hypothetical protein OKW96_11090 [Sphingobacterium sp. KU25419]